MHSFRSILIIVAITVFSLISTEQIAKAQTCPPNVIFGCSLSGVSANFGWYVLNNNTSLGDAIIAEAKAGIGLYGITHSNAEAVHGLATISSGYAIGVFGKIFTDNNLSAAVKGLSVATTGYSNGVWGETQAPQGAGVFGLGAHQTGINYGVYGASLSSSGYGVYGEAGSGTGTNYGVYGKTLSQYGYGVYGMSDNSYHNAYGVYGKGFNGIYGISESSSGNGIIGTANVGSLAYGLWGISTSGFAGYFSGNVHVTWGMTVGGNLAVTGTKNFKIDHPLDPANKYLFHASVESPEVLNIYSGKILLDSRGEAWVGMPSYFESLNSDFRYQLTPVGAPAPNLHVAQRVTGNRFKIAGGSPGGEVSWCVTGVRNDPYAAANRLQPEQAKPSDEVGTYLYPSGYRQPPTKGIEHVRQSRKR